MNILFIGSDPTILKEGSASRMRQRAYADEVARLGGTLHILTRASTTETITDGPLVIHTVAVGKLRALSKLPHIAKSLIHEHVIGIVSAQDPFEHGWIAERAVRDTTSKLHIQVHTDFLSPWFTQGYIARSPHVRMPFLNRLRVRMAGPILHKAQSVRVVSKRISDSIIATYGSTVPTPSIIPIAVSQDVVPEVPLPTHPFSFALIAVGRLEPEKRLQDTIAAIVRLKNKHPYLGLFIVGEGRERAQLTRMVQKEGLSDRIIFLGARPDARGLMLNAQAFIQTSAYEGYGLTLLEAALARIPIITSDVGIVGEVFRGYEDVLAAPVGDPTNFASLIERLINDHGARHELIQSAEHRAQEHLATTDSSPRAIIADMARLV